MTEMKFRTFGAMTVAALLTCAAWVAGCGGAVEGSTYTGNGGVVTIEFKSGGKAYVATGPISTPYSRR